METKSLYENLGMRTDNAVLIGVTGPTRTGKSTFVKRFMEQLVIPHIDDPYRAERAKDELPQCGSGRTIMTAEPKFVPEEAVEISPDGIAKLSVRLIDSVGYVVNGAVGVEEDGQPRMVTTPWFDYEIPMTQAAEIGTKKVMDDHCTVGIVVTTDGTITDLSREEYLDAEDKAICDMKATGKPFVVLVNTREPNKETVQSICQSLQDKHGVSVLAADCLTMDEAQIRGILSAVLYEFPVTELHFYMPDWVTALEAEHGVKQSLFEAMRRSAEKIGRVCEAEPIMRELMSSDDLCGCHIREVDLGSGTVSCVLDFPEELFYEILTEKSGFPVENDGELMSLLTSLSQVKQAYDKVESALEQTKVTGYGIVMPAPDEVHLELPEIVKKGGNYAIKLKASAPSIHMIRTDIKTEVCPIVGDEKQSRELADYLLSEYEGNTEKLWESNIFGKSLYDLVNEGLSSKIVGVPEDSRYKFRDSLTRIVNEGSKGLICIIL